MSEPNEEAQQPQPAPPAPEPITWENAVAEAECRAALNAKTLASNLIVSAQMLLRDMQTSKDKGGLTDKTKSASIGAMLEMAAKADVLGDRALVRYEKVLSQINQVGSTAVEQNEKLPVTKQ